MTFDIEQFWARPQMFEALVEGYENAFPAWYRRGQGSAREDVADRMRPKGLPMGFMALNDGVLVGAAALTHDGPVLPELAPWISGLWTDPWHRRRGVASALVRRCAAEARSQGANTVYTATGTAAALFERLGWRLREVAPYDGGDLAVYELST